MANLNFQKKKGKNTIYSMGLDGIQELKKCKFLFKFLHLGKLVKFPNISLMENWQMKVIPRMQLTN